MITAAGLGWTWADGTPALHGLDLEVPAGQRVLITGPSGCGKSTLIRLLAGLLPAHGLGQRTGTVTVARGDPTAWDGAERASTVGVVFQNPGDQLVAGRVGDELRMSATAAGIPLDVPEALARVGLPVGTHRSPQALSGGQQQRLVVAAGLAGGAKCVLLDEPLAHLDPVGASELLALLDALAAGGTTVILVEHRLEAALAWADRVLVLRDGTLVFDGTDPDVSLLRGDGLQVPPLKQVMERGWSGPVLPSSTPAGDVRVTRPAGPLRRGERTLCVLPELHIGSGECIAVVGPNGIGKSTLLAELAAYRGVVFVPQDPDLSLFCSSVADELAYGPRERGRDPVVSLEDFGLVGLDARSPHGLSRGQRLRLAVAAAVAVGPPVLLLDEPTAGQHTDAVHATLDAALAGVEGAVVFATHDVGLALRYATRVWVLGPDGLVADGPPHEALLHGPLPPLQREQARRGWPLADVDAQLASTGEGPVGPPSEGGAWTAREEPETPAPRQGGLGPAGGLAAVVGVGLLAVLLDGAFVLGSLAVASLLVLLSRPLATPTRVRIAFGVAAVVWSTMLSQGLFYGDLPRTAVFQVGPVALWWEGLAWGAVQSARLVAVSAAGLALALTVSPDRLLGVLRQLRVPGGLAFLAVTALRFVPVVGGEWWVVREARARRGRPLSNRGPVGWVAAEVQMLRPLVVRALRRARNLAESLDSRGFDVRAVPARMEPVGWADRGVVAGFGLVVAGVSGAQLVYALYLWELVRYPSLAPFYGWVRVWL